MFTKVTEQRFKGHFSMDCCTIRSFCNQRRRPLLAIKNKVCELQVFFPHFLQFFVVVVYICDLHSNCARITAGFLQMCCPFKS